MGSPLVSERRLECPRLRPPRPLKNPGNVAGLDALEKFYDQPLFRQIDIETFVNLAESAATDMLGDLVLATDLPADNPQRVTVVVV